jgi:hypothetical protein
MKHTIIQASARSIALPPTTTAAGDKRYFTDAFPLADLTEILYGSSGVATASTKVSILSAAPLYTHNHQETFIMHLLRRSTAMFLSILLALMPLLPAQAAMIGNQQIINQGQSHQSRDDLQQLFAQEAARQQLQAWGVNPDQIKIRIDSLTDAELAQINQQVNDLQAGGGVLGILLVIFIVFIITDVIGATDIFPFIHPVK